MNREISRRRLLTASGAALGWLAMPSLARSQGAGLSQPLTIVLGFAPGGGADNYVRLLAPFLSEALGQPVVVENRPGANGTIATRYVKDSKPDGTTLLFNTSSSMAAGSYTMPDLDFDPIEDLRPVTLGVLSHYVLIGAPGLKANNWPEFVALAQSEPGKLVHACVGVGSVNEYIVDHLSQQAGIKVNNVIYPGGGPAMTDLLANQAQFMTSSISQSEGYIRQGQVKALMIAAPKRAPQLPDVPASTEFGLTGVDQMAFWMAASVAKSTPDEIVRLLSDGIAKAQASPDLMEKLGAMGLTPAAAGPADYEARLRADHALYGQVFEAKAKG